MREVLSGGRRRFIGMASSFLTTWSLGLWPEHVEAQPSGRLLSIRGQKIMIAIGERAIANYSHSPRFKLQNVELHFFRGCCEQEKRFIVNSEENFYRHIMKLNKLQSAYNDLLIVDGIVLTHHEVDACILVASGCITSVTPKNVAEIND